MVYPAEITKCAVVPICFAGHGPATALVYCELHRTKLDCTGTFNQGRINAKGAKLVHQHRPVLLSWLALQQARDECRLASGQVACDNVDWHR